VIEETGLVVAVDGELAEVETQRTSACGGCAAKGGCGTSVLAQVFGARPSRVRVHNRIKALPGERVVVGLPEGAFLRAAFALYAVPLLGLFGGALGGEWLAQRAAAATTEPGAVLGGLLGLMAGLLWLRRFSRRADADSPYRAVILRRAAGQSSIVELR
jgi:sigma-E factor negative regulatory protein RseC